MVFGKQLSRYETLNYSYKPNPATLLFRGLGFRVLSHLQAPAVEAKYYKPGMPRLFSLVQHLPGLGFRV